LAADTDQPADDREPKLFVDVNVANFGLKRIIVYEGDTVESLVADFVKRCPIDDMMIEKLKHLLKQQMDGVLERIDEDEEARDEGSDEEEDQPQFSLKDGNMMDAAPADMLSENDVRNQTDDSQHQQTRTVAADLSPDQQPSPEEQI